MVSSFFIFFIVNNVQLVAMMQPCDEGINSDGSVIIEQEHKSESDRKKSFYPEITPESLFHQAVAEMCAKKATPEYRAKWKPFLIGSIKSHPDVLSTQKIGGQFPLSFAFNRRDTYLMEIFAEAEQAFFFDDKDSHMRRNLVLYKAVTAQVPEMVKILLEQRAPVFMGPDLLTELLTNCQSRKSKAWCCFARPRSDAEASALQVAKLLVEHGAPRMTAISAATKFGCTGIGCAYIGRLGVPSSAPPA